MLPATAATAALQAGRLTQLPLAWQLQRLTGRPAARALARSVAPAPNDTDPNQLLHDVCQQHGIHLDPSLHLSSTAWGLGLCQQQQQQPADRLRAAGAVVAVPLDLVLSCTIPGCSPSPQHMSPALQQLLRSSAVSTAWEMQVAVLLLWALRQPPQSRVGSFWQQYRPLLPGSAQDCSSLLVWSDAELQQLQDPALQATAQQWQQTVRQAYDTAVQPFFSSTLAAAGGSCDQQVQSAQSQSSLLLPAVLQPCSLSEWLWAVATVESRAFGAARADVTAVAGRAAAGEGSAGSGFEAAGRADTAAEPTGLVPVLDLANHAVRPGHEHRVDPATSTFVLFVDSMHAAQRGTAGDVGSSCQQGQQVLITYGSKDNRQLMEQYGFVVPGSPLDRVHFPDNLLGEQHGWMSHKLVKAAAQQVLEQHSHQDPQQQTAAAHVDAAVASILQYRGWRNAHQYQATTPASTVQCARCMLPWVQQQLASLPTTAAADATLLGQLGPGRGRLAAAVQYRLQRKLLLGAVAEVLQALVDAHGPPETSSSALMSLKVPMRRLANSEASLEPQQQQKDGVFAWQQNGYPMPDDAAEGSRLDVKMLYRPPRNDAKGIAIACGLIAAWAVLFYHGCWQIKLEDAPDGSSRRSSWVDIIATFFLLEFVNTGLFITTHDAMHGTICYRSRKVNDVLGRIAITLYAYFDYDMLHKKHWEHHNFTGQPGKDPDFHRGNKNLLVWYGRFMWEYTTFLQVAKIVLASQVLQLLGVPYANLCVYMAAAPLLAAFRLFYFGTYLPHLPPDNTTIMNWQKSHSSEDPSWLTFLKCYNFGLHWEHHRWPYAPWWDLPKAKAITRQHRSQQAQDEAGRPAQHTAAPAVQPAMQ